jgi:hypothetical protein
MAYFAKLDTNNVVTDVNTVSNAVVNDLLFPETEPLGIAFLTEWSGGHTNWKQTSYNGNFRVRYAGVGFTYLSEYDAFIAPSPFPSWVINPETIDWKSPVPYPDDGKFYVWDESIVNWVEVEQPTAEGMQEL